MRSEVTRAGKEHERPGEGVESWDLVADVDERRVWAPSQDDCFHGSDQW